MAAAAQLAAAPCVSDEMTDEAVSARCRRNERLLGRLAAAPAASLADLLVKLAVIEPGLRPELASGSYLTSKEAAVLASIWRDLRLFAADSPCPDAEAMLDAFRRKQRAERRRQLRDRRIADRESAERHAAGESWQARAAAEGAGCRAQGLDRPQGLLGGDVSFAQWLVRALAERHGSDPARKAAEVLAALPIPSGPGGQRSPRWRARMRSTEALIALLLAACAAPLPPPHPHAGALAAAGSVGRNGVRMARCGVPAERVEMWSFHAMRDARSQTDAPALTDLEARRAAAAAAERDGGLMPGGADCAALRRAAVAPRIRMFGEAGARMVACGARPRDARDAAEWIVALEIEDGSMPIREAAWHMLEGWNGNGPGVRLDCATALRAMRLTLGREGAPPEEGPATNLPLPDLTDPAFRAPGGAGKADVEPQRMTLGPTRGAAVRLFPAAPRLVVAEGIETALAAAVLLRAPAWAAVSAGNLGDSLVLPKEVTEVVIACDNDRPGRDAMRRASARWKTEGRTVKVALPQSNGADFNDVLLKKPDRG